MAFNLLLPAYPLDGGRIFADLLLMCGVNVRTAAIVTEVLAIAIAGGLIAWGVIEVAILTVAVSSPIKVWHFVCLERSLFLGAICGCILLLHYSYCSSIRYMMSACRLGSGCCTQVLSWELLSGMEQWHSTPCSAMKVCQMGQTGSTLLHQK